jgi:DNA-binding beta-propeller fold protein YncE
MRRFIIRNSGTRCAGDTRGAIVGEKCVMEWRKIVNCAVVAFACTAVLLGGCGSSSVNVITVTVSPTATTVIAGQVQTFTATVAGSTTTTVKNWPCTYSYTPLPSTATPNPAAVTGKCNSGDTLNGGSIGTWVITTTNGSNVLTYTAPALANFPSPPPTLTFTAEADADNKKTATAVVTLDSGIRAEIAPQSVTVPVGLTPAAKVVFQASLVNSSPINLQWLVTQPNPSDTKNTNNDTSNPLAATCSPTCGSIDANGIFTAPATLPTVTTPAGSTTTSPTTVYVVMNSAKDPLHYAVAAITLVSATNNSINFTGIFPATVAAGSALQEIYLNAENLLNTTQIFFIPPGQTQGLPIVSTNIFTIPISTEYCTASASGVTPVVTCGASLMTRIELTSDQLATAGTAQIEITGIPGNETATPPCTNVPNADGSTTTSNISCPLTIAYASPALVAAAPDSFPLGSSASIAVDGGYYGSTNAQVVKLLLDGSSTGSFSSSGSRRIVGSPQGSTLQNPGLYEVTIQSNAPLGSQPAFPTATTNVAVQPTFANFNPNPQPQVLCPNIPAIQNPGTFPPCLTLTGNNPLPSSFALDSAKGFAVLTEQGTNALQLIDLTGPAPQINVSSVSIAPGSAPTSVALDDQINIPGYSGQDLGVVVSSGDSKLYLYAISRTSITPIGSIPVDLNTLLHQTATTQATPYAVGVDPGTHLAALAYASTNIGFIVDVNPNLDSTNPDPHTCFITSQNPPCVIAPVSMVTGSTPQVVMSPGAPLAYVTPGDQGSNAVVDLLQQGVTAQIAPAVSGGTSGAVRTSSIVKIITIAPHGINPALGGSVIISGLMPADLNGTYQVIPGSVIDPYTFSYAQNGNPPDEVETNTASNPGTVQYGTPYYSFNTTSTVTGAAINPTTRTLAFADPNANIAQITFIATEDQAVTGSLTLTAGSCNGCTPAPAGAPEIGFRSVSFDPFTNVLVTYDPSVNSGSSFPGNAISLINPGSSALTGAGSLPYRIIAAIPTGQVGTGSYTPAGQTTAVTVNGPMIYDPKSKFVLAANAGSNTVSYLNLDGAGVFKKVHVQALRVTSAGSAVPNAQPALGAAHVTSCDPTNPNNPCMPQAVRLGQSATLQILGEGFLSGGGTPLVRLDGSSTGVTIVQDATHVLTDSEINVSVDASLLTVAHDFAMDVVTGGVVSNSIDLHAVGVLDLTPVCAPTASFPQGPEGVAIDDSLHIAFVTNYACNSVSLITIDPLGFNLGNTTAPYGSVLTTVPVGNNPIGVAVIPRLGYAVAANSGDTPNGTASIIDYNHSHTPDKAAVVPITITSGSTTTTANSVTVGLAPRGVAIDQDRALALVANSGSNTLSSIDLTVLLPGAVTTTSPVATTVALSGPPTAIAISPDQAIAVVTNLQNTGTSAASAGMDVVTLSGTTPVRSTTASVTSLTASLTGIVFDPVASPTVFYATSTQQNAVYVFDPNTGSTSTIRVGINPYSVGYDSQTGTLLTINSTSNTSSVIDSQNLRTRQTLGISSQSQFAVAVDNWFNTAVIVDQNNNRVLLLALPK